MADPNDPSNGGGVLAGLGGDPSTTTTLPPAPAPSDSGGGVGGVLSGLGGSPRPTQTPDTPGVAALRAVASGGSPTLLADPKIANEVANYIQRAVATDDPATVRAAFEVIQRTQGVIPDEVWAGVGLNIGKLLHGGKSSALDKVSKEFLGAYISSSHPIAGQLTEKLTGVSPDVGPTKVSHFVVGDNPLGNAVNALFERLDRPLQSVLVAGAAGTGTTEGRRALKHFFSGQTKEDIARFDTNKDGRVSLRESLAGSAQTGAGVIAPALGLQNLDDTSGGAVGDVLSFLGEAVLDPIMWGSLGSTDYATFGRAAVARELGADAALEVARKGTRVLTQSELDRVYARILKSQTGGLEAGSKRGLSANLLRLTDEELAAARAQRQLSALKHGQGTVKLFGQNVPGSQLLRRAAGKLPGARKVRLFRGATEAEKVAAEAERATAAAKRGQQELFSTGDNLVVPTPAQLRSDVLSEGVAKRARNAPIIKGIQHLLSPRAATRAAVGPYAATELDFLRSVASGKANNAVQDMLTSLTKLAKKADKELGSEEARRAVRRALDQPSAGALDAALRPEERVAQAAAELRAAGNNDTVKYLEAQSEYRRITDAAAEASGLDPANFRENYMPRIITPEGAKAMKKSKALREDLFGAGTPQVPITDIREQLFQRQRTFQPNLPIDEVNKIAQNNPAYGLKPGEKLFEEDPLAAFASRGRSSLEAASRADLYDGITKIVDESGERIAIWGNTPENLAEAKRLGFEEVQTAGGSLYVHKDIVGDVVNMREALTNDETLRLLHQIGEEWSGMWATYHTVTPDRGLGFHARNVQTNLGMNALGGVVDPKDMFRAGKIQADFMLIQKDMARTGATFEEALSRARMSPRNKKILASARDHDIFNRGFIGDLGSSADPGRLRGGVRDRLAQARRSPGRAVLGLVKDNPLPAVGRFMGAGFENNARLTHYIAKLNKMGSADEAAASVRRFLFDYGDLTEFERTKMKKINRFYTFARKNTALQLWALAHTPGRVTAVARANRAIVSAIGGDQPSDAQPNFDLARGSVLAPGLPGTRNPGIVASLGIDTALGASIDFLQPLYLAAQALPGTPGKTTSQEFFQSLHEVMSGPQVSLVDLFYEQITKTKLFPAGAPVEHRDKEEWVAEILDLIGPSFKSLDRLIGKITSGQGMGPLGNEGPKSWSDQDLSMAIFGLVLGLQVFPISDRTASGVAYAQRELLQDALKEAKRRGHNVPTVAQLQDAGWDTGPFAATKDDNRPPSERAQEAFDTLNPALQTPTRQAEITQMKADEAAAGLRADGSDRNSRARELALSQGNVDSRGRGALNNETKLAYNAANPNDPFLNDDGSVFTQLDVKALQWNMPTATEVMAWARDNGASIDPGDTSVPKPIQAEYNKAFPAAPYYRSLKDRIRNGMRPTVGVYFWENPDGTVQEYWPEGLQPATP